MKYLIIIVFSCLPLMVYSQCTECYDELKQKINEIADLKNDLVDAKKAADSLLIYKNLYSKYYNLYNKHLEYYVKDNYYLYKPSVTEADLKKVGYENYYIDFGKWIDSLVKIKVCTESDLNAILKELKYKNSVISKLTICQKSDSVLASVKRIMPRYDTLLVYNDKEYKFNEDMLYLFGYKDAENLRDSCIYNYQLLDDLNSSIDSSAVNLRNLVTFYFKDIIENIIDARPDIPLKPGTSDTIIMFTRYCMIDPEIIIHSISDTLAKIQSKMLENTFTFQTYKYKNSIFSSSKNATYPDDVKEWFNYKNLGNYSLSDFKKHDGISFDFYLGDFSNFYSTNFNYLIVSGIIEPSDVIKLGMQNYENALSSKMASDKVAINAGACIKDNTMNIDFTKKDFDKSKIKKGAFTIVVANHKEANPELLYIFQINLE